MIEFVRISSFQDVSFVYGIQQAKHLVDEQFNTVEMFDVFLERKLRGYFHDFFIVMENGQRAGVVMAYDYRVYDAHCKLKIEYEGDKESYIEIIRKFTKYMFEKYPLNRIFTLQTDKDIMDFYLECGFTEEAVLKEYAFLNGTYCDVSILALDRI